MVTRSLDQNHRAQYCSPGGARTRTFLTFTAVFCNTDTTYAPAYILEGRCCEAVRTVLSRLVSRLMCSVLVLNSPDERREHKSLVYRCFLIMDPSVSLAVSHVTSPQTYAQAATFSMLPKIFTSAASLTDTHKSASCKTFFMSPLHCTTWFLTYANLLNVPNQITNNNGLSTRIRAHRPLHYSGHQHPQQPEPRLAIPIPYVYVCACVSVRRTHEASDLDLPVELFLYKSEHAGDYLWTPNSETE